MQIRGKRSHECDWHTVVERTALAALKYIKYGPWSMLVSQCIACILIGPHNRVTFIGKSWCGQPGHLLREPKRLGPDR